MATYSLCLLRRLPGSLHSRLKGSGPKRKSKSTAYIVFLELPSHHSSSNGCSMTLTWSDTITKAIVFNCIRYCIVKSAWAHLRCNPSFCHPRSRAPWWNVRDYNTKATEEYYHIQWADSFVKCSNSEWVYCFKCWRLYSSIPEPLAALSDVPCWI